MIAGAGRRQDRHARPSRRPSDPRRRRPQADHAGDLLAPRRRRTEPARAAPAGAPPHPRRRGRRDARLRRHFPFDRRAAVARLRAAARPRSAIHHSRPRGFGRPHELCAPRARPVGDARSAFRPRERALRSIRASSTAAPRSAETLGRHFPWCAAIEEALRGLFAAYVEAKQRQSVLDYDDLLLYFAQMMQEPDDRRRSRRALRPSAGRRIPGHQPPAGRDRAGAAAAGARADGGRRRRAVDLFVPRRHGAQHPRFPDRLRSAGASRHARSQLSLDQTHSRRLQRGDRPQRPSASPRTCGPIASRARRPCWRRSARRPTRRAMSHRACWRTARPAPA